METIYFIDSENVGDSWIELLDNTENDKDRFLVFYTGHSPRIAYPQAIQLLSAVCKPEFIECHEGNNGLDFQLVSYLGYELHADCTKEMIIVSNDTGFDAAVLFWKERGMKVKRVPRPKPSNSQPTETNKPVSDNAAATSTLSVGVTEKVSGIDKKELYTIINCIGKGSPSHIHLAFVHFYGSKNGENIYKHMKSENFAAPSVQWTKETKMLKLIELIMKHSGVAIKSYPDTLPQFIADNVLNDKSAMSNKLNKMYGNQSSQIHKVFKPYYGVLAKIKKK